MSAGYPTPYIAAIQKTHRYAPVCRPSSWIQGPSDPRRNLYSYFPSGILKSWEKTYSDASPSSPLASVGLEFSSTGSQAGSEKDPATKTAGVSVGRRIEIVMVSPLSFAIMVVIIVTVVKKQTIEVEARQRIPDLVRNEDLLLADILRDKAGEHGDYSFECTRTRKPPQAQHAHTKTVVDSFRYN